MTTSTTVVLYCDGPADLCPLRGAPFHVGPSPDFSTPDRARDVAAFAGWSRPTRRLDLCPVCTARAATKAAT